MGLGKKAFEKVWWMDRDGRGEVTGLEEVMDIEIKKIDERKERSKEQS